MVEKPSIPKHISALLVLSRMSSALKSDVLADETIAKRWGIGVARTASFGKERSVPSDLLFSNLQRAANGEPLTLWVDDEGREFSASVTMERDGSAIVRTEKESLRFEHVSAMSSNPAIRLAELEKIASFKWLSTSDRNEVRALMGGADFSAEVFFNFPRILSSSPLVLLQELREKVKTQRVKLGDFFSEGQLYWNHLAAPWRDSPDLRSFIANELAEERKARIAGDPGSAFRSMSLTFCAPALVPHDLFEVLGAPDKLRLLEDALSFEDPFSRIGAFELCAGWSTSDPAFVASGEKLLDSLFVDMKRLENQCALFGAGYVLATARIAEDQSLKPRPAFWRRLAAASHAGLIVRAFAGSGADGEELLRWAMTHRGSTYYLSVLSDFPSCPRWRPEWIDPRFLVADISGRARGTVNRLSDAPPTWKERMGRLDAWLEQSHMELLTGLPAVLEGDLPFVPPILENLGAFREPFQTLMKEQSLDALLLLTPAIHAFGLPSEARASLDGVVSSIRRNSPALEEEVVLAGLKLLSHIAVTTKDRRLADAVVETCMERLPIIDSRQSTLDAAYRFVECRAADPDGASATMALARRLEHFAFLVRKESLLLDVVSLFETIKTIDPTLECRLGRALAVAKLGASKPRVVS
jgi:hypothetical protein